MTGNNTPTFDPTPYLKDLSDGRGKPRLYLPAAARILWFRAEHPITSGWGIRSEALAFTPAYIIKATIANPEGQVVAEGHAMCEPAAGKTYSKRELEKAETSAIARALSNAGYGTQFALEVDDDGELLAEAPLPAQPRHWAFNGGGERINARLKARGLAWDAIRAHIEPGRELERLSDTRLTEAEVLAAINTYDPFSSAPRPPAGGR